MAYDADLAERVRGLLAPQPGMSERRMFGGLCFLLWGNMACGLVDGKLMLRVGRERCGEALAQPHVAPMDFTGRPLKGRVYVLAAGVSSDTALRAWLDRALQFSSSLPRKLPGEKRP